MPPSLESVRIGGLLAVLSAIALDNNYNMLYNVNMNTEPYTTMRVWVKTLKKLRMIAVLMDTTMVKALEQMAEAQLRKLPSPTEEKE